MVKRKQWKRKERIKEGVNKPTEYEWHNIETLLQVTKETRVLKVTVRKEHQVVVTNDTWSNTLLVVLVFLINTALNRTLLLNDRLVRQRKNTACGFVFFQRSDNSKEKAENSRTTRLHPRGRRLRKTSKVAGRGCAPCAFMAPEHSGRQAAGNKARLKIQQSRDVKMIGG